MVGRDALDLKRNLASQGILVRYFNKPGLQDHIRISVGKPEHTDTVDPGIETDGVRSCESLKFIEKQKKPISSSSSTWTGRAYTRSHTGIGFLDHMLTHLAVHGLFDLQVQASGDLEIDSHHTIEDCALVLGQAFDQALGKREGIVRIASAYVPMDESLAFVAVDLSGRPYSVFQADWRAPLIGYISHQPVRALFPIPGSHRTL